MTQKSKGTGSKAYHCDSCGESWVGTTNRVASRPLNQAAVASANAAVGSCQRLQGAGTGKSRRITMKSEDYLCRRKWMDAYLSYPPPTPPPPPVDPEPPGKVSDPVSRCPHQCALLGVKGICEHHENGVREAHDGQTLEVVPSSVGTDTVELDAEVEAPCGDHPMWVIDGVLKTGAKQSFPARGPVSGWLWLISIDPVKYAITCTGCQGSGGLAVYAYPPNQWAVNLDLKKSLQAIRKGIDAIREVIEVAVEKFEPKYLEGRVSVQAGWKEYKDYRAFYSYKIDIGMNPLIGGEMKFVLTPLKVKTIVGKVPYIGKYFARAVDMLLKAGVYFKMSGGIEAEIKWERKSPDDPKYAPALGAGITGKWEPAVGAEVAAIRDELIRIEIEATGAFTASGEPFLEDEGFGLECKIDFEGLKGTFKMHLIWGLLPDWNPPAIVFIEPKPLWGPKKLFIHKNGTSEDGAEETDNASNGSE